MTRLATKPGSVVARIDANTPPHLTFGTKQVKPRGGVSFFIGHSIEQCRGTRCAIHFPSGHPLVRASRRYRYDFYFLIERQCAHGNWHPDPDSIAFELKRGNLVPRSPAQKKRGRSKFWQPHDNCCGCCGEKNGAPAPAPSIDEILRRQMKIQNDAREKKQQQGLYTKWFNGYVSGNTSTSNITYTSNAKSF